MQRKWYHLNLYLLINIYIYNTFILVNRLIKYTHLENAAEFLYDLGILNLQDNSNKDEYSSDSDEFDTENYRTIDDQYD